MSLIILVSKKLTASSFCFSAHNSLAFLCSGEMVYILEQRLHAQNIPDKKSVRVLRDVVKTMYNPKFIRELFVPQKPQTMKQTLEVFNNLAHSSIMRLNESSMGKLFDLMTMGVKYQCMQCVCPTQYVQITLNHLESLKLIVSDDSVEKLLDAAAARCISLYSNMSLGTLYILKHTICDFFQDRRVKVSIFLQEQVQNNDGTFKIRADGPLPPNATIPGSATYHNTNGNVRKSETRFQLPWTDECSLAPNVDGLTERSTMLGLNMYATAENGALSSAASLSIPDAGIISLRGKTWLASLRKNSGGSSGSNRRDRSSSYDSNGGQDDYSTFTPSTGGAELGSGMTNADREQEEAEKERRRRNRADGRQEMNLLASLLGRAVQVTEGKVSDDGDRNTGSRESSSTGPAAFRMSLFAEDPFASAIAEDEDYEGGWGGQRQSGGMQTVHVEARTGRNTDVRDDINTWGEAGSKSAGGKTGGGGSKTGERSDSDSDDSEDDLLGLLDEADAYTANHK